MRMHSQAARYAHPPARLDTGTHTYKNTMYKCVRL